MDKTPFNFYDFFGYLAPAPLLLASIDYFLFDEKLPEYTTTNSITGLIG